jgi:hypothetical protein
MFELKIGKFSCIDIEALWSTINLWNSGSMLVYFFIPEKMEFGFVLKPKDWKRAQFWWILTDELNGQGLWLGAPAKGLNLTLFVAWVGLGNKLVTVLVFEILEDALRIDY